MKYAISTLLMLVASAVSTACSTTLTGDPCGGDGQPLCIVGCNEGYSSELSESGDLQCAACGHLAQRCCENRCRAGLSCAEGVCMRRATEPSPGRPDPRRTTDCMGASVWPVIISDPAGCVEAYPALGDSYEEASRCLGVRPGWRVEPEGTRYRQVNLCQSCVGDPELPVSVTALTEEDAVTCATSTLGDTCTYTPGECPEEPSEP